MPDNNTTYRNTALKATAQLVKAGPVIIYGFHVFNQDNTNTFLQCYDALTAASVTVGTTTPTWTFAIPASGGYDAYVPMFASKGGGLFQVGSGLVVAATTSIGGAGAPATGLLLNLFYNP